MRKILSKVAVFFFISISSYSQTLDETVAMLTRNINKADSASTRIEFLQERAALYEISGRLDLALKDYSSIIEMDSSHRDVALHILQLRMEMGENDILSDISEGLLNSPPDGKSSWIVLQLRYLLRSGQWNEAEMLINQYKNTGVSDPAFIYLAWYIYSSDNQFSQSRYWAQLLIDRFPQSPETMLYLGLAENMPSPEKLFWTGETMNETAIYYYQVGAYSRKEGANDLVQQLADLELESEIIEQGPWFKVLVPSKEAQNDSLENKLIQIGLKPFRVDL